jgi:hypothetical protein
MVHSTLRDAPTPYTDRSGTLTPSSFASLRLASLNSSSKLASVQLVLNFCLPAAGAALASKRNLPECSAKQNRI